MTDPNRPAAYHVIDEQDPKAIVATFGELYDAQVFCEKMDPDGKPGQYRFTVQPVRPCAAAPHS